MKMFKVLNKNQGQGLALRTSLSIGVTMAVIATVLGSSSAIAAPKTTISFYSWDPAPTMKPIISAFEKKNPNIKLQVTYGTPVIGYISTLQIRLNSGTAPDVFIITAENKQQIMDGGFAQDLSREKFASNIATAAKATYSKNGKLYGGAVSSWGGGILYNKDLLAKVGFTNPPKTWTEFLALTKKLQAADITPFYEPADGIPVTLAALLGIEDQRQGGKMDAQIFSGASSFSKSWTNALTTWSQLFTTGAVSPSVVGLSYNQIMTEFQQGKVAMLGTGSWALGGIQAAAPSLNLGFFAVPGASSTYWAGAVSPGFAVNAKTKKSAAAKKFVEFLTSDTGVGFFQKATQGIMTTKSFSNNLDPALSDMVTAVKEGKFYLPQVSWPSHSAELNTEAVAQLQLLILGKATPAAVSAALDAKLKSLNG